MLVEYVQQHELPYITDPTNENTDHLRPRLRAMAETLSAAGLSSKRLANTAARLNRAAQALDAWADKEFQARFVQNKETAFLNWTDIDALPEEIAFRVLQKAFHHFATENEYSIRMHKLEDLLAALWPDPAEFKGATLGGYQIRYDLAARLVTFQPENRV
jgi:tRNA(Ile)-lysidine synthase